MAFSLLNTRSELFPIAKALGRKLRHDDVDAFGLQLQRIMRALPWERGMSIVTELAMTRTNVEERWVLDVCSKSGVPLAVFSRVHKWFSQLEGYNVVVNFCRFQLMCAANVVGEALQALLLGVADLPSRVLPACLLHLLFIPLVHWRADDSMASRELFNRCVERDAACASIAVAARWQIPAAMITSQNNKLIRPTCGVVLLAFLHQQLSIRQQQPVYASHTSRWLQVCAQHRREDWRSALHFFRL